MDETWWCPSPEEQNIKAAMEEDGFVFDSTYVGPMTLKECLHSEMVVMYDEELKKEFRRMLHGDGLAPDGPTGILSHPGVSQKVDWLDL